jgi:2-isopropylmalate synthase
MKAESIKKYRPFHEKFPARLNDRTWPDAVITRAPIWCSVDLRDGNQALAVPMGVDEKMQFFALLCAIGFKEIEVGFPAASDTEFRFLRRLVEEDAIPADVTVQVLVQAREHLIRRTFESLEGVSRAIVHVYNSTSPLQRRVTFGNASRDDIRKIAVDGVTLVRELTPGARDTHIRLEYSPESFSDTETEFALGICEEVLDIWGATAADPAIVNLPATVEWTTPNVHADQIEWFCRNLSDRQRAIVSLHTHNDRGTGIAATELGLLAGADRVEGTLFGNGERTGNLDIVTVALNMNSHGIATGLDFSDLPAIRRACERFTRMGIHERHPYAGELVFTAFSGSHQDAIKKGMDLVKSAPDPSAPWEVPYLTIDPRDIGRTYEAIIRINSQSGKGGVAYVLDREYGLDLPKRMHPEVGVAINELADARGTELSAAEIWDAFEKEFLNRTTPIRLVRHHGIVEQLDDDSAGALHRFDLEIQGRPVTAGGEGNGPINALANALGTIGWKAFRITDYRSQAIGRGSAADAAAYVEVCREADDRLFWGCGVDPSIEVAGLRAAISAINRSLATEGSH